MIAKYTKDNLPVPVEDMPLHRKTSLTPMVPMNGPFSVETQEGDYHLPDDWQGFLAVDNEGFPYPISSDNYMSSYELYNG